MPGKQASVRALPAPTLICCNWPEKRRGLCATNKAEASQVGVRAKDERTLEVELERPTAYFLALTSFHAFLPPVHRKRRKPTTNG